MATETLSGLGGKPLTLIRASDQVATKLGAAGRAPQP